jgi:cytochrome c
MWATMAARGVAMPAFKPEEMADLVSFLYFFQFIDRPGDPRRGETAWREKRCGGCHVASGEGVAPPPAAIADKHRAPLELITAMWNHSGQMQRRMAEANIPWPVFKRGEMADVIAFLLSPRAQSAKDKDAPR